MAFNANIPQATDLLSTSQGQILGNFTQLNTAWLKNHVDFNAGDAGKHKWVTFPQQGATPPAGSAFAGSEVGLYNAISAGPRGTGINELYANKQSFAGVKQIPATASILSTSSPNGFSFGWTYLPSGIIMYWGNDSGTGGSKTVTFPTANIPLMSQVVSAQVTTYLGTNQQVDSFARLVAAGPTAIQVWCSQRTTINNAAVSFTYLVIGY